MLGKEEATLIKHKRICVFADVPSLSQRESEAATEQYVLDESHRVLEYELNSLGHRSHKTHAEIVNKELKAPSS